MKKKTKLRKYIVYHMLPAAEFDVMAENEEDAKAKVIDDNSDYFDVYNKLCDNEPEYLIAVEDDYEEDLA